MPYQEMAPEHLLAHAFRRPAADPLAPALTRWDALGRRGVEELVDTLVPDVVDVATSGSAGAATSWRHSREQLWTEAGILADLVRADEPQAVLSFAPPTHLYGLIGTVLLPAALGLPLCYWPRYGLPAPPGDIGRWLIVAIPWAFPVLLRDLSVLGRPEQVTVLHSTATLPATAREFTGAVGADRVRLIEVFGSTETGAVAHRPGVGGDPAWTLMPDVRFQDSQDPGGDSASADVRLSVSSPRLALTPAGRPMPAWTTDDHVRRLGDRAFLFQGRRGRLIKVNGRRIDLDHVEDRLRAAFPHTDLVCLPVADRLRGEHIELVVAGPETRASQTPESQTPGSHTPDPETLARGATDVLRALGLSVGRIRRVAAIERGDVGKPRRFADEEAVTP